MDDILELASRLGKRIAADPRGQQFADARAALEKNQTDRQLLADFEQQQVKLRQLELAGKPIEPDDKRRILALQDKVIASSTVKNLLKAQADYMELMALITSRIEAEALGLPPEEPTP